MDLKRPKTAMVTKIKNMFLNPLKLHKNVLDYSYKLKEKYIKT